MSDTNKNTCPVCFTRMRNINKVLTCPECGYKYCDHSRELQDMFDTSHVHTPNYTTSGRATTSPQVTYTRAADASKSQSTYTRAAGASKSQSTYTRTAGASGRNGSDTRAVPKNLGKIIKIIVTVYVFFMFLPAILGTLGTVFLSEDGLLGYIMDDNKSPEVEVSSALEQEGESSDLNSVLDDVGRTTPIMLEGDDGDFIPELIKNEFNVSDWRDVTYEQISNISFMDIYQNMDGSLCANYYCTDGHHNEFVMDAAELNTADFNVFIGLENLYTLNITYLEGDLSNLQQLKTLHCQNTPEQVAKAVHDPSQLRELGLSLPSQTSSLEGLEQFTGLGSLEIHAQNAEITDAQAIADLENLYILSYMDSGKLKDFDFLSDLSGMNYLYLNAPGLPDISFVENMPQLHALEFYSSDVTDLSPLTSVADTLTSLSLSSNTFITDLSPLSKLTKLEYLTMDNCNLTDLSFTCPMESLTWFSMANNSVTSLEPLKDLPNLQYLYTFNNPIEDYAGLEDLCN